MDRRQMLKGVGAILMLPLLPAIVEAKPDIFSESDSQWKHYAVTLCDGEYTAMIDGQTVTRPTGRDYDILEALTEGVDRAPAGPVVTADIWKGGPGRYYDSGHIS